MSSEYIILQDTPHVETQAWEAAVEAPVRKLSLALAKPETTRPDSGFLTPNAVRTLTDQQVKVFAQFGLANHNPFSDADYADAGAEFTHHYADLSMLSHLVITYLSRMGQILTPSSSTYLFMQLAQHFFTLNPQGFITVSSIFFFCLNDYSGLPR